jgi:hypothetical protein
VIRNVVLVELKPDADLLEVAEIQRGLAALDLPGTLSYMIGPDAGLRAGNWSWAIVADFVDAAAYLNYDEDAEHNALRARLAPMAARSARVQFEVSPPDD